MKGAAKSREGSVSQSGFTVAELVIVLTIILIVIGLSIPSFSRTIDSSRLKAATQKLAGVYQDSRLRATQNNTAYEVLLTAPAGKSAQACIDLDGDGVCGNADPVTVFPGKVKLSNIGVPMKLDATQLNFQINNTETSTMHTPQDTVVPGLAWNARGLPCQRSISAASNCLPTGWVQHVQYQRANGEILYGAVSVSPTGRVKTWTYISSGNGNGQWF